MLSVCLKCRENAESINPETGKTKHGRIMLSSKLSLCNSKKSKFFKEKGAIGLISNLTGVKIPIHQNIN